MFIIVHHTITHPGLFWSALKKAGAPPAGSKVHHMLPSIDGKQAVCLWESADIETIRTLVDGTVGTASTNTFFAVDAAQAMGLPK